MDSKPISSSSNLLSPALALYNRAFLLYNILITNIRITHLYTIVSKKNIKIIKVFSERYGNQDWKYGRVEHRVNPCSICGGIVVTVGYHSATRGSNKNDRICT